MFATIAYLSKKFVFSSMRRNVDIGTSILPRKRAVCSDRESSALGPDGCQLDRVVVKCVSGTVRKALATAFESSLLIDCAVDGLGFVGDGAAST